MMTTFTRSILMAASLASLVAGCKPAAIQQETSMPPKTPRVSEATHTTKFTFSDLPVPPKPETTPQIVEHGKSVYLQNCAACHGVKGDGRGDAAAFLLPKPR